MVIRLVIAGLLLAHALIHVAFLAPPPPATAGGPSWPFATDGSWVASRLGISAEAMRVLALALVGLTIAAFALAALVAIGVAQTVLWVPALTLGCAASIVLLVACFHPWLALGIAIDVALLWAALVAGWVAGESTVGL